MGPQSSTREYVQPNHLIHDITALAWSHRSPANTPKTSKKKPKTTEVALLGLVALGTKKGKVLIWDLTRAEIVCRLNPLGAADSSTASIHAVVFSSDGSRVFASSDDKLVMEFNIATTKLERTFKGGKHGVTALAATADGSCLVTGHTGIKIFDLSSGKRSCRLTSGHASKITSLAFSPDGSVLLSAAKADRTIHLFYLTHADDSSLIPQMSFVCPASSPVSLFPSGERPRMPRPSRSGLCVKMGP